MNWKRVIAFVLVVTMTSLCAGCSWIFMEKKPNCTSSMVAPVVDSCSALLMGGFGVLFVAEGTRTRDTDAFKNLRDMGSVLGGVMVLASLLYVVSAATGFHSASECKSKKRRSDGWIEMNSIVKTLPDIAVEKSHEGVAEILRQAAGGSK